MNLAINHEGDKTVYILTIDKHEYMNAHIEPWTRLMLKECDQSNLISDKLLALEAMARTIESQTKEKSK